MPQTVGTWRPFSFPSSYHLSLSTRRIRLCHGKFLVFSRIRYTLIPILQVGILNFTPSGGSINPILRGPICHYWIAIHYPTVHTGKFIDSGRLYHRLTDIQMIGGFIHPGRPMANMYFVLYGYSKCHMLPWVFHFQY